MTERRFTGRHAAILFVGSFGIIISVNVALAVNAVRTFPGLEVKNSYVASQEFNDRLHAQTALGWTVDAEVEGDHLVLSITDRLGTPVRVHDLSAVLGRATHVRDDRVPDFAFDGRAYVAPAKLGPGNWNLRLSARADDGTEFQQRVVLRVKG